MMQLFQWFAATGCSLSGGNFLAFPHWYKYLQGIQVPNGAGQPPACSPQVGQLSDIWLILAAVVEIILRIAGLAAVAFVIYGGVQYMTSRGEPDKATRARQTIFNALIGLVAAIGATTLITFVAGRFN